MRPPLAQNVSFHTALPPMVTCHLPSRRSVSRIHAASMSLWRYSSSCPAQRPTHIGGTSMICATAWPQKMHSVISGRCSCITTHACAVLLAWCGVQAWTRPIAVLFHLRDPFPYQGSYLCLLVVAQACIIQCVIPKRRHECHGLGGLDGGTMTVKATPRRLDRRRVRIVHVRDRCRCLRRRFVAVTHVVPPSVV